MGRYNRKIHIGSLIDALIRQRGMSYAHFARLLNCDRTTVYNIVRAKSIDIDRLIRISEILDYDFIKNAYTENRGKSLEIEIPAEQIRELENAGIQGISIRIKTSPKS